jgi:predicted amidohydrolase
VWLCGSMPEAPEGSPKPFNALVLAGPNGKVLHRYHKIHPFSFAREHEHYATGEGHVTVDVEGLRCTLFICYDLRFADEFWGRADATDAYIVVANWPERRRRHWTTLLQARAIENQAYVVGVNRVGHGSGLDYSGDSRIIDPWGEILAAGAGGETMLLADLSPDAVRDAREKFPVLKDRRR